MSRDTEEHCFASIDHPGDDSYAAVYGRAMVAPIGVTLLPIMLFTLAAVLLGQRIWPYFFWACLPALVMAWGWAQFQIGRAAAEICVRPAHGTAALRSVSDVVHGVPRTWLPLARLRVEREAFRIDLGDTSHRLPIERWPANPQEALARALNPEQPPPSG